MDGSTRQAEADALAARMGREINALIEAGTIPPSVRAFRELHEHIDANTLGGTEAMVERLEQAEFVEVFNAAVTVVDSWLGRGRT